MIEIPFPYDFFLFVLSAIIGFIIYTFFYTDDKETRRLVIDKFKRTNIYRNLGLSDAAPTFREIEDKFSTFTEVSQAVKEAGLASSNLIIGIDFTASNEWQGRKTFGGKSLHSVTASSTSTNSSRMTFRRRLNPYQKVIHIIAETLAPFDEDQLIPVFGFGDVTTKDTNVFPLNKDSSPCKGLEGVLSRYNEIVRDVNLSGPTSFAPIIHKAIEIIKARKTYHILVIIADGQVEGEHDKQTREAIVEASNYPLSIIVVGVGDGPWEKMDLYDCKLPQRKFDNFQFINYHGVIKKAKYPDAAFALHALMEIPDQFLSIKKLGLLPEQNKISTTLDSPEL